MARSGLDVPSLSVDLPAGLWQDARWCRWCSTRWSTRPAGGTLTLLMPGAALSGDADLLRGTLRSLRATGVRVGLARLGDAGPVSLDTLRRLPLDELTLDARVLERLGQRDGTRMAAALIGLGRALGLRVVAGRAQRGAARLPAPATATSSRARCCRCRSAPRR